MENPRSILITGGSSGIGQAIALHYARPGIQLFISGRNPERLQDVAKKCQDKGANIETSQVSVTDRVAMADWIKACDSKAPLDLVIANAGISGGTAGTVMKHEPLDQVRTIFDTNINGVVNTIEPILETMIEKDRGQIAIISSLAGFRGWPGAPAYCASKAAVKAYAEGLRGNLLESNVHINVVLPGFVESRMTDKNDFPMPFLVETDKAAQIIAKGLSKNKGRIAFPFPVHFFGWLVGALPDFIAQHMLKPLPAKTPVLEEKNQANKVNNQEAA